MTPFDFNGAHRCVYLVTFAILFPVVNGNLCVNYSDTELQRVVSVGAVPTAGVNAGIYRAVKTVHTLRGCVVNCCFSPLCDTVFLHHHECYLIQCNSPAACQPRLTHDTKFNETYLLSVKSVKVAGSVRQGETSTSPAVTTTSGQSVSAVPCSPDDSSTCGPHEACHLVLPTLHVCDCIRGYTRNDTSKLCTEVTACTLGLFDCPATMQCVPYNTRSRVGTCQCGDGFVRDNKTHECVRVPVMTSTAATVPEVVMVDKKNTATSPQKDNSITTVKTSSSQMTTVTPTTTTTIVSTTTTIQQLVVSAGENKVLQLPQDDCTLSAYTVPADTNNEYHYKWSLISSSVGEQLGKMSDIDTATCKLSELKAGFYMFQVVVSSTGKYGEAYVNVTVLQPARNNTAPIAIVNPTAQKVNQPNDVVIDGSGSTDDTGVVKYHWVQVSGPLNNQQIKDEEMSKPMLVLKGLSPGDYRFKLIVTDSDGVENSTIANVTLIKEKDYPPKANAGSNKIISLPKNAVILYGNGSTDDKGITSYEWTKKSESDKLAVDMRGVRTPFLHLEHLEAGDYTFTLKVMDTAQQVSTSDVHVFVKQEQNQPPEANAGEDQTVFLPTDFVKLNGAKSKDDQKIESFLWTQLSGPSTASIENADRVVATASKLALGVYKFQLTVTDAEKLESSSTITVIVKQNTNKPPVADAGDDQKVYMPVSFVSLDGSKSTDDKGIVSYKWVKNANSLAAGVVLNNSDKQSVLALTNLVVGRYIFELTVLDEEGLSSTATASVVVMPYLYKNDLVEMYLKEDITEFTEANKKNLLANIALLMHSASEKRDLNVHVETLDMNQDIGCLVMTFYVETTAESSNKVLPGTEVVEVLRKKLRTNADLFDFKVERINTLVCHNNCSGHGHCSENTKRCVCEPFWMENFVNVYFTDAESNCDWSVLYVIIISFILVVACTGFVWLAICLCKRWQKLKPKKRCRYSLLPDVDNGPDDAVDRLKLIPKDMDQYGSLRLSDVTSDEETLFVTRNTKSHIPRNGFSRNGRSKVKT